MVRQLTIAWAFAFLWRARSQELPTSVLEDPESTFFSTAWLEYYSSLNIRASDGDLWPTTWADDGNIYTSNGDGRGFSTNPDDFSDIVVNRIRGTPETGITGDRLAFGEHLGPIWTAGDYNRKPTGIIAVDGDGDGRDELYLVVQDLNNGTDGAAFNDVPAASIAVSRDYGATWTNTEAPMFTDFTFTTVWFLDYGQSNANAAVLGDEESKYVYAYGIDNNWRASVNNAVPDPESVYLARVPIDSIQNITKWEWFSGSASAPSWSQALEDRQPVLTDSKRVYLGASPPDGYTVISQGSVVYNAPLNRYLYTSWSDYTFEFYEAPQPWGPFTLFLHKDFGVTPWFGLNTTNPKNGGYATTIPSKFISEDGKSMWVQSNFFVGVAAGSDWNYCFSLRSLTVDKFEPSEAINTPGDTNLAVAGGTVPIDKTSHFGSLEYVNDGETTSEDSWDGTRKSLDRWGYTWPAQYRMNRVVYTTGAIFPDGGYFASNLKVQVRQDFGWVDVSGLAVEPAYPYSGEANPGKVYTFTFEEVVGDGVQIVGVPGGEAYFTSISELEVYYSA